MVYQIVGRSLACAHSATSDVFPNPAGAITKVAPGTLFSNNGNKCLRDKNLALIAGGCERGRLTPEEVMCFALIS
jgi:hypothetical protein